MGNNEGQYGQILPSNWPIKLSYDRQSYNNWYYICNSYNPIPWDLAEIWIPKIEGEGRDNMSHYPRLVAKVKNRALAFFNSNLNFPAERTGYNVVITRFLGKYEIY